MLHAVLFLVPTSKLMLLDAAFHVVVNVCCDNYAVLRAAVHGLRIDIIVVLVVLHQPTVLLEGVEVLHSLVIDFGVMLVGAGLEVNLRLYDMVERLGVTFGLLAGFLGVEHVVGTRGDLSHKMARGTHTLKWFHFSHDRKDLEVKV